MAGMIGNLVVKMATDNSQFERGMTRSMKHLRRFDKGVQGVAGSVNALVASYVGWRTAVTAARAIMEGGVLEREQKRLEAFAGSAANAAVAMESFNRASAGTIDSLTGTQQATRILQLGLAKTPAELEKIVSAATRLGKQTETVEERLESFTSLLANQSMLRLDNFGISADRVRVRMEELKNEFPNMTKEARFMAAAYEQIDVALGKLGPRQEDTLTQFERMTANMKNLKLEIAQGLAPVLADLAADATKFFESMDPSGSGSSANGISRVAGAIVNFGRDVVDSFKVIGKGIQWMFATVWGAFTGLIETMWGLGAILLEKIADIPGVGKLADPFAEFFHAVEEFAGSTSDGLKMTTNELAADIEKILKDGERRRAKYANAGQAPATTEGATPFGGPATPGTPGRTALDVANEVLEHMKQAARIMREGWKTWHTITQEEASLRRRRAAVQSFLDRPEQSSMFAPTARAGSAEYYRLTQGITTADARYQSEQAKARQRANELLASIDAHLEVLAGGDNASLIFDIPR